MKIKKLKKVWSLALAGVMALSLGLFNADLSVQANTGDYNTPATAYVTKTLQYADKITTPNIDFKFTFTPASYSGGTVSDVPAIPDATVSYNSNDTKPLGQDYLTKNSVNIFDAMTTTWQAAGVYTYEVTEQYTNVTEYLAADNGTMTFSQAKYTLYVTVANDSSGRGLYISKTECKKTIDDDGSAANDPKGDPAAGGLEFVNVFTKKGGIEKDADALVITKTVSGDLGSHTKLFDFTINFNFPSTADSNDEYNWVLYDADGTTVSDYGKLAAGVTSKTFSLAHNQKFVFTDLPAGTTYELIEAAATDYTPSFKVLENSESPVIEGTGTKSSGLSTYDSTSRYLFVGENENTATFNNDYPDGPITGILVNNLPYILLIAAAMLGLVAFVAVKRRREMR